MAKRNSKGYNEPDVKRAILRTALLLRQGGRYWFTLEELLVEAWKLSKALGLKGFENEYVDNNKFSVRFMGADGYFKRGWFEKAPGGKVGITLKGIEEAEKLGP